MNLCVTCKLSHDQMHKIIDYDKKNFICNEHNESFSRYCNYCKKNICMSCEEYHQNHETISIMPDLDKVRDDMNILRENINVFNNNIKSIIKKLEKVMENMEIYYNMYNNIIKNYDNKNRNYELYKNINEINNRKIMNDLDKIIKENNFKNKINYIM